jgi:hypothetical protein
MNPPQWPLLKMPGETKTATRVPLLNLTNRFILRRIDLFTLLAPFWEESRRLGSALMNYRKCAVAGLLLPGYGDAKAQAEPKHNIACVP